MRHTAPKESERIMVASQHDTGADPAQNWFHRLKRTVEQRDTQAGKWFDTAVSVLIVLNLIAFSIDTLPDLPGPVRQGLHLFEALSIGLFTLEYVTRLAVADRKLGYIFSFWGLIDLAAIAPVLLMTGADLRALRVFRLLRLLNLFRYGPAIRRFRRAFEIVRDELLLFASVALSLLFVTAVGIYLFERDAQPEAFQSIFHALWWSVVTLTTVGYGDVVPVTVGGRIFTFFVLIIGIGIVAVPTGLVTSALSQVRSQDMMQEEKKRAASLRARNRD